MTAELEIYPQIKGFWRSDAVIPYLCSVIKVTVKLCGKPCNGTLTVNGRDFETSESVASVSTDALSEHGRDCVSFTDGSGVSYACAEVIGTGTGWRLPSLSESVTEAELLELLAQNASMRERLCELASNVAAPISQVLGI